MYTYKYVHGNKNVFFLESLLIPNYPEGSVSFLDADFYFGKEAKGKRREIKKRCDYNLGPSIYKMETSYDYHLNLDFCKKENSEDCKIETLGDFMCKVLDYYQGNFLFEKGSSNYFYLLDQFSCPNPNYFVAITPFKFRLGFNLMAKSQDYRDFHDFPDLDTINDFVLRGEYEIK